MLKQGGSILPDMYIQEYNHSEVPNKKLLNFDGAIGGVASYQKLGIILENKAI